MKSTAPDSQKTPQQRQTGAILYVEELCVVVNSIRFILGDAKYLLYFKSSSR